MKLRSLAVAVTALALSGAALAQDTTSEKGRLSYFFGYQMAGELNQLTARGEQLDINSVVKGLQDAYAKKQPAVSEEQIKPVVEAFQKREQGRAEEARQQYEKVATDNKARSNAFLAENRAKAGVKLIGSDIQYRVIDAGAGAKPTANSTVALEVAGPYAFGQRPEQVRAPQKVDAIKVSDVELPAMREVLQQMPVGAKWEITLPPEKAYGADPRLPFPPNVAVQFEVKLVGIK